MAILLGPDGPELVVDLAGDPPAGLDAADALARLVLAVRRAGGSVRVVEVAPGVARVLELAGLRDEIPGLRGEVER